MENFEGIPPVSKPAQKPEQLSGVGRDTPQVAEMDSILQRVLPIEDVFNPDEEVQRLWLVPKEQRREVISAFKDKLARQREAWALCRTTIEGKIEADPDITRRELIGIIDQFASSYGFAKPHIKIAEQLVDGYITQHKRVVEVRKQYPNDIALINRLTGMKFAEADAEDFTIAVGPMTVDISCSGSNAGRIFEKSRDQVVGFKFGGFASQSNDRSPIYYVVINRNPEHVSYRQEIRSHEHEHEKNRLLWPRLYSRKEIRAGVRQRLNQGVVGFLRHQVWERVLGFERNFEDELFARYESSKDPQQKAFFLEEFMRLQRGWALNSAKDEIIALSKDGRILHPSDLDYYFFSKNGDPLDYLAPVRDWDKGKSERLWTDTTQRVLVDEYKAIIKSAVSHFNELVHNGYSREEVIALLSDKSLPEWPKTARRLLETKLTQS